MGIDLGTFLAVYGTLFDGSAVSLDPGYSIGGAATSEEILGLGLLGTIWLEWLSQQLRSRHLFDSWGLVRCVSVSPRLLGSTAAGVESFEDSNIL